MALSSTRPGSGDTAIAAIRFRYAPPMASHDVEGILHQQSTGDHSVGASQYRLVLWADVAQRVCDCMLFVLSIASSPRSR